MFQNTSKFRLEGNATNSVLGDQYNNCRIHVPAKKVKKRDSTDSLDKELSQFQEFIRGNIRNIRTILDSEPYLDWQQRQKPRGSQMQAVRGVKRTIFTANVCSTAEGNASKVTVMTYRGRNASVAWKRDFRTYSQLQSTDSFQLLGINRSKIPALIFHSELLPFAHVHDPESFWMTLYVSYLLKKFDCGRKYTNLQLWIDTTQGAIVSGPEGPYIPTLFSYFNQLPYDQVIPATADMLNQGALFRYFSNQGSSLDGAVVVHAGLTLVQTSIDAVLPQLGEGTPYDIHWLLRRRRYYLETLWNKKPVGNIPTAAMDIISKLDFTTVYSGKLEPIARCPPHSIPLWIWKSGRQTFSKRRFSSPRAVGTVLDNGLTRFNYLELNSTRLILDGRWKYFGIPQYPAPNFTREIVAQLPRIVNGIEGVEKIVTLEPPLLSLRGSGDVQYDGLAELFDPNDTAKGDVRPIYLFMYPPPMTVSGLIAWETGRSHFWSFDEAGQSEITDDERKEMGLPALTAEFLCAHHNSLRLWTLKTCDAIRDWQIARGFNPTTADFARHLGYPEFEIIGARNKDKLGLDWLWSAFSGSDISACLC